MIFDSPKKKPVQKEKQLQIGIVALLRKHPLYNKEFALFHGASEGKRTPWYARLLWEMGLEPGEPDLKFDLPRARVVYVEIKHGKRTSKVDSLSDAQIERHKLLKSLGHEVHVIKDEDPNIAFLRICQLLGL